MKIAAAKMGLCAYFLPHRRGVKFYLTAITGVDGDVAVCCPVCAPVVMDDARVAWRYGAVIVYSASCIKSLKGKQEKGSTLVILVSNSFFAVLFALLAVAAVMMARRCWAGEAVSAAVAAVGCVLPLASVWAAPAARDGNVGALILVVSAYILAWLLALGGCAGVWVFARSRAEFDASGEKVLLDGGAL